MQIKDKGILISIGDVTTTKTGVAVQQIGFEQENGTIIYPSLLGPKISLASDMLPGDIVEIEYHIKGSKGTYNNVIIDNLTRV